MRSLPTDLEPERLRAALASGWDLGSGSLEYLPEGGGAYHWQLTGRQGQRHFVTVDDLDSKDWIGTTRSEVFAGLGRALGTATTLANEAELEFVVAPIAAEDGEPLRRIDDRYAVSVFPFLPGRSFPFGPYADERLRLEALDLVAALHQATAVVRDRAPAHVPGFAGRADLAAFLGEPDQPWVAGPFGEDARAALLAGSDHPAGLAWLIAAFDQLVDRTGVHQASPVITHGEPHPANLRSSGGRLYLIDWDTVGLGPPERDLSLIVAEGEDLERYRRATGRDADPVVITLYRLRWYLDDLASAVKMFRNEHRDTAETRRWRDALPSQLDRLPGWIELAGEAGAR
ncbi:MAG TPA: phosphotransferase [Streptosporangiaceae bacterium]|nr:phosphotransferase [Streptosporangiaceae bacterium]